MDSMCDNVLMHDCLCCGLTSHSDLDLIYLNEASLLHAYECAILQLLHINFHKKHLISFCLLLQLINSGYCKLQTFLFISVISGFNGLVGALYSVLNLK